VRIDAAAVRKALGLYKVLAVVAVLGRFSQEYLLLCLARDAPQIRSFVLFAWFESASHRTLALDLESPRAFRVKTIHVDDAHRRAIASGKRRNPDDQKQTSGATTKNVATTWRALPNVIDPTAQTTGHHAKHGSNEPPPPESQMALRESSP
jgi:hypothetical protein